MPVLNKTIQFFLYSLLYPRVRIHNMTVMLSTPVECITVNTKADVEVSATQRHGWMNIFNVKTSEPLRWFTAVPKQNQQHDDSDMK